MIMGYIIFGLVMYGVLITIKLKRINNENKRLRHKIELNKKNMNLFQEMSEGK